MLPVLKRLGHEVQDFGCDSSSSCDYPDFAAPAAKAVSEGKFDVGVLFDGSGIGMSVVANKICGVRAALAHDEVTARIAREHNHCNVLCIGTDLLSEEQLRMIVEVFLATPYQTGRHDRRIAKIAQLEREVAEAHVRDNDELRVKHVAHPNGDGAVTPTPETNQSA
jgi:ribose 5-phosphate isomerase B